MSLRAPRHCGGVIISLTAVAVVGISAGIAASSPASRAHATAHASSAAVASLALTTRARAAAVAVALLDDIAAAAPAAGDAAPVSAPPADPPVVEAPVAPAPAIRNRLVGPNGLNTAVGVYSVCNGQLPLPSGSAAIDTCVPGRQFFVGHNPGVFTPLITTGVGAIITWYDGDGIVHPLRVIQARSWQHIGLPALAPGATAQFQTCIAADGSVDLVLDAAPA